MTSRFKIAALSTLMICSGAALAQQPAPPPEPEQSPPTYPEQTPPMTPSDQTPSDRTPSEQATPPASQTPSAKEAQWPDFRTADANGDGYVSKTEAQSNPALADVIPMDVFTAADADQNGSLSSAEYDAARREAKNPSR